MTKLNVFEIAAILTLALSLGGCRFGNYTEPAKFPPSTYKSAEIFFNEAKTFQTVAIYNDDTNTQDTHAALSHIPIDMSQTMSEPAVYLVVQNDSENTPFFIGMDGSHSLQTGFSATDPNLIDASLGSSSVSFFGYPACQTYIAVLESGQLDRSHPSSITYSDGTVAPVAGRIKMDLLYAQMFKGDCSEAFTRLSYCYQTPSPADCSKDEIAVATETLDLYVKLSSALNVADIPKLKGLAYQIHFE